MKAYGIRALKNKDSLWSNIIAVSNDINKLSCFMINDSNVQYVGSPDKHDLPNIVRYTAENIYPRFMIEEIPYVV